jgi:CSLREA domain-containing protein
MQRSRPLPILFPGAVLVLILAACGEDQSPTAPTSPAGSRDHALAAGSLKVVNSLADPGNGICNATQCTLREAINDPASTEISFAAGLTGTITLAPPAAGGGTLRIAKTLSITGPSQRIVIRGRSPNLDFPVFRIGKGGPVTLRNLTIREGGGGIINRGTLTLINSVIEANSFAISSTGDALAITNSFVVGNSGGITVDHSRATITNTRIAKNSGVGIGVFNAEATLTNSTVAGNSGSEGGGIVIRLGGDVTLTKSTVVGNSATVAGGGIFLEAGGFCRLGVSVTLSNSTVSGNSAPLGGGIFSAGCAGPSVRLTNSTVARNSATQQGGGIFQAADEEEGGRTTLTNALVAQNSAPTGPDFFNSSGEVFARFSLIGDGTGSPITNTDGNQVGNVPPNTSPIDSRLGPLADNGGPTRTHALLLGSPAIDAASTPICPTTDQRGVLRPQGPACDIGSYERQQ